jgi:hypothetical protein
MPATGLHRLLLRRSPQQLLYLSVIERTFSWPEVALRKPHCHHCEPFEVGAHEPKIDREAVAIGKQCIVGERKIKPPKWETICSIGVEWKFPAFCMGLQWMPLRAVMLNCRSLEFPKRVPS